LPYILRQSPQGQLACLVGLVVFGLLTLLGVACFPVLREWLAGLKKSLHFRLQIEVLKIIYAPTLGQQGRPQQSLN
jgi:hypothetical protein